MKKTISRFKTITKVPGKYITLEKENQGERKHMKKIYYVEKHKAIRKYKNLGIASILAVAHVVMHNNVEYLDSEDERYYKLAVYCDSLDDMRGYQASLEMMDWALEDITVETHEISYFSEITSEDIAKHGHTDEFTKLVSLSAFTILDLYATTRIKSTSFNQILQVMTDSLNQYKKRAFERNSTSEFVTGYICNQITDMLAIYKLYIEYKSGDLNDHLVFEDKVIEKYIDDRSGTDICKYNPYQCIFDTIDREISRNPYTYTLILLHRSNVDTWKELGFTEYCLNNLMNPDRKFSKEVFSMIHTLRKE